MKLSTRQLAQTALLLAICIASQFFKNLSVYITGPVVNTTIIIAVLAVGLWSGLFISVIAPITAFFISGSPIMAAIPLMFPAVMGGNMILAVCTWYATRYFQKKMKFIGSLPAGLIAGSVLKAAFMGIVIVLILLPAFGGNIAARLPKPEALPGVLATAKVTFSVTQLITSLTGSLLAYIIWMPLKKYLRAES
ncbi:MAG: ECF transporter S component [Lachnospiraceae bacterium]|nr:ECF transporter S component [Lachnospiraceae bacterium]